MEKDKKQILEDEARFQDSKIETSVRANQSRYYMDKAAQHMKNFRLEQIGNLYEKKVLDLGCGDGNSTIKALKAGAYVTAIDISPRSIEFVKELAIKEGLSDKLTALVADAQNLPFPGESFDIVIGGGILHHLTQFETALKEIKRVLKSDGHAVFHEPLGMNPFINLYRKFTPTKRTDDEKPLGIAELNLIKSIFPSTEFGFFDNATLISKIFVTLHLDNIADKLQGPLISIDKRILKGKPDKITFMQKLAWVVIINMKK